MKRKQKRFMTCKAILLALALTAGALTACSGRTSSGSQNMADIQSDSSESTSVEADATEVKTPAFFTAEGGTGRVTITCPEVVVTDGAAEAKIVFSSPHYEWVKVDGQEYDPINAEESDRKTSEFRIPVRLDEKMKISGLTTAMSEPHEVEYTITISLTRTSAGNTANTEEKKPTGDGSESAENDGEIDADSSQSPGNSSGEAEASAEQEEAEEEDGATALSDPAGQAGAPELPGLTFVSAMEKDYAEGFDVYKYSVSEGSPGTDSGQEVSLIDVHGSGRYLLLPEGAKADPDLAASCENGKNGTGKITILQAPLDNIYVAATSSMALFDAAGAMSQVRMTGTKETGWYIDAPKKAMQEGSMVYAGKYSAPDYELLASSGCDLAVESMMILHAPEVKEKLEELGIPVFIDTSSNESHPLGRTEWVRLYGVLTGHEEEAEAFFTEQKGKFAEAADYKDTGKTVAFFSISSNGNAIVRATDDYIPRMIELAGGHYIFKDLLNETGNSASVRLSMEDFYNTAKDADYLVYNATIESPVGSIQELCGQSSLLADFKAVQDGKVWQVQRSLYQSPDIAAQMITDIHRMLAGEDASGMVFLEQLQ